MQDASAICSNTEPPRGVYSNSASSKEATVIMKGKGEKLHGMKSKELKSKSNNNRIKNVLHHIYRSTLKTWKLHVNTGVNKILLKSPRAKKEMDNNSPIGKGGKDIRILKSLSKT